MFNISITNYEYVAWEFINFSDGALCYVTYLKLMMEQSRVLNSFINLSVLVYQQSKKAKLLMT